MSERVMTRAALVDKLASAGAHETAGLLLTAAGGLPALVAATRELAVEVSAPNVIEVRPLESVEEGWTLTLSQSGGELAIGAERVVNAREELDLNELVLLLGGGWVQPLIRPVRPTPEDASEIVARLPRRTAHALHALIAAEREWKMPVTAGEVAVYDAESLSARGTGRALSNGTRAGLCVRAGRYWVMTPAGHDLKQALEDRFLRDTTEELATEEG